MLSDRGDLFVDALHGFLGSGHHLIPEDLKLLTRRIKGHGQVFSRLNSAFLYPLDRVIGVYSEARVQHPRRHANGSAHHCGAEPNSHAIEVIANGFDVDQADNDAANGEQKAQVVHRVCKLCEGELCVPFLPHAVTHNPVDAHHRQREYEAQPLRVV
ncbi:hypothetical protein D3C72_1021780 [compost metagenome]